MKAVFMGTPEIAAEVLKKILKDGTEFVEVIAAVTQPDKPKGRGREVAVCAVKQTAQAYQIPVYQPQKAKDEEFLKTLKELAPDVILVAAYGKLLPKAILTLPPYGCINVHASLLPKYRGASPIQWAVINGEQISGITIMQMEEGLDTGDILLQREISLDPKEKAQSLHDKLARLGGSALLDTLRLLAEGKVTPKKQEESEATYVGMIEKSLGHLDFTRPAEELERLIRGVNPWPGAYSDLRGKTIKFWDTDAVMNPELYAEAAHYPCGAVVAVDKSHFYIKCGSGLLLINELQMEGKKRMNSAEFMRGCHLEPGMKFGGEN